MEEDYPDLVGLSKKYCPSFNSIIQYIVSLAKSDENYEIFVEAFETNFSLGNPYENDDLFEDEYFFFARMASHSGSIRILNFLFERGAYDHSVLISPVINNDMKMINLILDQARNSNMLNYYLGKICILGVEYSPKILEHFLEIIISEKIQVDISDVYNTLLQKDTKSLNIILSKIVFSEENSRLLNLDVNKLFFGSVISNNQKIFEILSSGCDINIRNHKGKTPLMYSTIYKDLGIFKFILSMPNNNKADISILDNKGYSVFHMAIRKGNLEALKILVKEKVFNKNEKTINGENYLNFAVAERCNIEIIKFLSEFCDPNEPNKNGFTALHLAINFKLEKHYNFLFKITDLTKKIDHGLYKPLTLLEFFVHNFSPKKITIIFEHIESLPLEDVKNFIKNNPDILFANLDKIVLMHSCIKGVYDINLNAKDDDGYTLIMRIITKCNTKRCKRLKKFLNYALKLNVDLLKETNNDGETILDFFEVQNNLKIESILKSYQEKLEK